MSPSTIQKPGSSRLRELDGWRAISVLLVVVYHLGGYQYSRFVTPHVHLAMVLDNCGPLGVKVFFVISGFVICRLLILEEKRFGSVSLKGFYIRRVFRILPPLFLYLACLGLLLSLGMILESWRGVLSSALFLYDLIPAALGRWFVGHTWSLAVEEQFYVTFPSLWVLTRKIGRAPIFLAAFCLFAGWNLSSAVFGWNHVTDPNGRTGFACICCGVLLATFETQARAIAKAMPALAVAAVAFSLAWHPGGFYSWRSALFDSVYTPLAIAVLLIFSLEHGGMLRTFLCSKPIQAIGLASYGVYLWQQLFTAPLKDYTGAGKAIQYLLLLLPVIVMLSYLLIEKPAMRLGKSLAARTRHDPARERATT